MAHHSLVDTCVWVDLASDPFADEIISRLEDLVATTHFQLVVPQVVREEFDRHKTDCAKKLAKKLSDRVAETIRYARHFSEDESKPDLIAALEIFQKRIEVVANAAAQIIARIDKLFDLPETTKLETTDEILTKAAMRGYEKKAPFTSNKNSVADAIIVEAYLSYLDRHPRDKCSFGFVTLNKSDFADPKDQRRPHSELGEAFTNGTIRYAINFAEEINRLIKELPPAKDRARKLLSEDVVQRAEYWLDPFALKTCPACGTSPLMEVGWRGFYWHKRCNKCGLLINTGESMED